MGWKSVISVKTGSVPVLWYSLGIVLTILAMLLRPDWIPSHIGYMPFKFDADTFELWNSYNLLFDILICILLLLITQIEKRPKFRIHIYDDAHPLYTQPEQAFETIAMRVGWCILQQMFILFHMGHAQETPGVELMLHWQMLQGSYRLSV